VLLVLVGVSGERDPAAAAAQATSAEAGRTEPVATSLAARSPRNANYSIDATLDPARALLSGRATITWRNITEAPTTTLRFNLYWNAWKNTGSSWMRELLRTGFAGALARRPANEWAWIDLASIRLVEGGGTPFVDLTARRRFVAPDDGNADDETVVEIPLPSAVEPGQTITLEVEWQAQVPRTFARTGRIGDFHLVAHWFPKIGVLDTGGWHAHQFHAGTEFFADYGVYDVRLRVPTGWIVGATGREQEQRANGDGTTTHRYVAEDVHDFAWTTSPDLVERRARFEHTGLPPVELRLLLQPEHAGQEDRHFAAARAALRYYGEWFGPYPYDHLTIVDPAWQSDAEGMEYPTLITAGTRWLAPSGDMDLEDVTVHETGHQFWHGVVGNDEVEHAWLDEGLNTFAAARTMAEAFSPRYHSERFFQGFVPWVYRDIVIRRTPGSSDWAVYRRYAEADAPVVPAWQQFAGAGGALTYYKTSLWLHTLERLIGWETLQRTFAVFFRRSAFRHPSPDEFFQVANEISGRDLSWFFDQVHRGSNTFDYAVAGLTSAPRTTRGYRERNGQREFSDGTDTPGDWVTTVVVRREGEAYFPVELQVVFEDGERVRERWDGRSRWRSFTFVRPVAAVAAEVDPDRVLLLDVDATNNSRTLAPRAGEAATKWSLKWLVWIQDLLMTYGFFV
jgi:hypothetical protein